MDAAAVLAELEQLATKLKVDVRYDRFVGEGVQSGLCRIRGKWRAILERRASPSERASMLARCLARFPLEDTFLSPQVRELVERTRRTVYGTATTGAAPDADAVETDEPALAPVGEDVLVSAAQDASTDDAAEPRPPTA